MSLFVVSVHEMGVRRQSRSKEKKIMQHVNFLSFLVDSDVKSQTIPLSL